MNATRASRLLAVGLTGAALLVAGCGGDDDSDAATSAGTQTAAATTADRPETVRPIRNPYRRPELPAHGGGRLETLTVRDVRVGDGETVQAGDTIIADYAGAIYQSGRVFDSSWQRGREPIEIPIDNGGVIAGWWQGLQGARVGGRRTLAIPSALGYGEQGSGSIPPNADLYFVVDILGVRKAEPAGPPDPGMAPAG